MRDPNNLGSNSLETTFFMMHQTIHFRFVFIYVLNKPSPYRVLKQQSIFLKQIEKWCRFSQILKKSRFLQSQAKTAPLINPVFLSATQQVLPPSPLSSALSPRAFPFGTGDTQMCSSAAQELSSPPTDGLALQTQHLGHPL